MRATMRAAKAAVSADIKILWLLVIASRSWPPFGYSQASARSQMFYQHRKTERPARP
jgi:hypothetical protein